ncbi:MAG: DUF1398 family protein [Mucilaginibacter sp.]|nr:DUF1398 family protein [Mucilaginibacter sp.]
MEEIKQAGLLHYTFHVENGATVYTGSNGHQISGDANYELLDIYPSANAEVLYYNISMHQAGHSDFITFCKQVAACDVATWVVNTQNMFCTYYDKAGNKMLEEPIPAL